MPEPALPSPAVPPGTIGPEPAVPLGVVCPLPACGPIIGVLPWPAVTDGIIPSGGIVAGLGPLPPAPIPLPPPPSEHAVASANSATQPAILRMVVLLQTPSPKPMRTLACL